MPRAQADHAEAAGQHLTEAAVQSDIAGHRMDAEQERPLPVRPAAFARLEIDERHGA